MFYTVSFPPKVSSSVSEVLLDSASGSLPRWFRGTSEQVTLIVFFLVERLSLFQRQNSSLKYLHGATKSLSVSPRAPYQRFYCRSEG